MRYAILAAGDSPSFPEGDAFLSGATAPKDAEVLVVLAGATRDPAFGGTTVVELGTECLADHVDETETAVLGFARYRNGTDAPSPLVELVRLPATTDAAVDAARRVFEGAGLTVTLCSDQAGRIIDRLVRPKYNAALRFLDEGLASQADMDLTCRLGLGYRDGPIERIERGGLAEHYRVTQALFETYGTPAYAPARRALVAARRARRPA